MANRRTFLKGTGTAGVLLFSGVSGCIGDFSGSGNSGGGGNGEENAADGNNSKGSGASNGSSNSSGGGGGGELTFLMSPTEPQNYMMRQYAPVKDQLENKLGGTVNLQYARNYSAIITSLGSGVQDIAETGPFAAALGVKAENVEIALQRYAYGAWDYSSVVVTSADSDIESLSDLEGKKVGFADTTSASGSLYPLYMLKQAGLEIGEAPTSDNGADFTGSWSSHTQAIEALQAGQVDAAGVGKFIAVKEEGTDKYLDGVRLVKEKSGIPRAPIVVSPKLAQETKQGVIEAFVNAPDEMYYGKDGEEDPDDVPDNEADDLWFSKVRKAGYQKYKPVIDVANKLNLSSDLLDSGTGG